MEGATRPIYWNITDEWVMYALVAIALLAFANGCWSRYRRWMIGTPAPRMDRIATRALALVQEGLLQRRIRRDTYAGAMHLSIFVGFIVLFVGTVVVLLQADLGLPIMHGVFYLVFQSLLLDLFGLVAIVGILMALYRRYIIRPDRLRRNLDYEVMLWAALVILVTGFILEGIRIAVTADSYAIWSPVGFVLSAPLHGLTEDTLRALHGGLWWGHLVLALGWIAYVPYSNLFHMFSAPANIFLSAANPREVLPTLDLETAQSHGAGRLDQFSRKDLFELNACTQCGRCEEVCPAHLSGKLLSPRSFILGLQDHLNKTNTVLPLNGHSGPEELPTKQESLSEEAIWSCTTCLACQENCPVFVEHVPKLVEIRRHLVATCRVVSTTSRALDGLSALGSPWEVASSNRIDWIANPITRGRDITNNTAQAAKIIFWVGCTSAYDPRAQEITRATISILESAGVDFALLGSQETCCGDPARRMGEEGLFQELATQNMALLKTLEPDLIITQCPHCLNTLSNEYLRLGLPLRVVHHSQFISGLIQTGRIKPKRSIGEAAVFHDPCYLGRYNNIYDDPRRVLEAIPDLRVYEPKKTRTKSMCCGAGGGQMWIQVARGKRIESLRFAELQESGARLLATACPYCNIMLSTAAESSEAVTKVKDIAELVVEAGLQD